ncbi:uncharacterized protein Z518_06145 [Rhinocladiella mackenziei CBS 650.93]|uniref:Uncharacterized protein n=1 Tax=Rhinocladiella mackenziei CBS 650.93 TaxID=1442369 RepID=A0A0D2H4C9_9EURO|nr:uncharacterized protein Z518_06145 [Rhinocladiella mackenziei CBS 650.93]KIX05273.1 hypothetical protein Z518_06145 [Rhinocladiella mackenziei CBS 650.93]
MSESPLAKPEKMPLRDWMCGDRKTDITSGWFFYESEEDQKDKKDLLPAVICKGWGIITPGRYYLDNQIGFSITNGKDETPSKHMLEVLIKDENKLIWRQCLKVEDAKWIKAIPLGQTTDGQPLYLCQTKFRFNGQTGLLPGVVGLPGTKGCCGFVRGKLYQGEAYELLCSK